MLSLLACMGMTEGSWLRRNRAWCPVCLRSWAESQPVRLYSPLLWSIRLVTICPVHLVPLVQLCPACKRASKPLAGITAPGYCGICGAPLWSEDAPQQSLDFQAIVDDYQKWCAEEMSKIVAAIPSFTVPTNRDSLAHVLSERFSNRLYGGTDLAAEAHCSRRSIALWSRGQALPRVETLFRFAFNLHAAPIELLREVSANPDQSGQGESAGVAQTSTGLMSGTGRTLPPKPRKASPARQLERQNRGNALKRALGARTPPTLLDVARRLGIRSSSALRRIDPAGCNALREKRESWEAVQRSRVKRVFETALQLPRLPSFKNFCVRMHIPITVVQNHFPELRKAYILRFRALKQIQRVGKAKLFQTKVGNAVRAIWERGEYPSAGRVVEQDRRLRSGGWDQIQSAITKTLESAQRVYLTANKAK